MPKRDDINKILIIGSGPIIISQACEFDYSGTQACKALKEEGFKVVLINSNPATIMTDPEMADATYIEPITPDVVEKIIIKERPDALLPTLGGQTGLNTAMKIYESGVLDKYKVKMIGADYDVIKKAEDRNDFKKAMQKIGLDLPDSGLAYNMKEARDILKKLGLPIVRLDPVCQSIHAAGCKPAAGPPKKQSAPAVMAAQGSQLTNGRPPGVGCPEGMRPRTTTRRGCRPRPGRARGNGKWSRPPGR